MRPLQNELSYILTETEISKIFCNVEDIFEISHKLLEDLNKENLKKPELQCVGTVFSSYVRSFPLYYIHDLFY